MALGGVFMKDTDGNIGGAPFRSSEQTAGLLFDISKQAEFFSSGKGSELKSKLQNSVLEINSMEDLKELGITPFTDGGEDDLLFGIPYYHIDHFFKVQGRNGRLYIMFADCTANFDAIITMQHVARGMIHQIGVWTDQVLWEDLTGSSNPYTLSKLVANIETAAEALAAENTPVSVVVSPNSALIKLSEGERKQVELAKIPSCVTKNRYVSVLLGQEISKEVSEMQKKNSKNCTPVGAVGAALGCLSAASVHECIGWVNKFNLSGLFPDIELGFGDVDGEMKFNSTLIYSSLSAAQIDALDDRGYNFLCKYSGIENGVYFNKDHTCTDGDYNTIARNRTINKSRRAVRQVLLPYVNSPIKVDPSSGSLSAAQISIFQNMVSDVLAAMQTNGEISGFSVFIDPAQNVLKNDTLIIQYSLIPVGVASRIEVVEGLALKNK